MREKKRLLEAYEKAAGKRRITFGSEDLHALRGRFIVRMRRNITWKEFAEIVDVKPEILYGVRSGLFTPYPRVLARIIKASREHGIMIHASDYVSD